jgi:hypothetical protein
MPRVVNLRKRRAPEPDVLYVGVDEAGYGPNLGPLIVAATAIRGPASFLDCDWWKTLAPSIGRDTASPFVIDDSKRVLARPRGFERMARTVEGLLLHLDHDLYPLCELIRTLAPIDYEALCGEHWHGSLATQDAPLAEDLELTTPGVVANHSHDGQTLSGATDERPSKLVEAYPLQADDSASLCKAFARCGLEVLSVRARVLFPQAFNDRLNSLDTKADVEMELVESIVAGILADHADLQRAFVWVDRLGGRRYYRPLVERVAGDAFPITVEESALRSEYRFESSGREVSISFRVEGDSIHLPIALASMVAKYVRERSMEGFNEFWARRIEGLAPTAGYPGDARRFFDCVRPELESLGIPTRSVWRER